MEKKINLEEILANAVFKELEGKGSNVARMSVAKSSAKSGSSIFIKEAMLEFGKQLLELAAENVKMDRNGCCEGEKYPCQTFIDKQSILDTINQIE